MAAGAAASGDRAFDLVDLVDLVGLGVGAILLLAPLAPHTSVGRTRRFLLAGSLGLIPSAVAANEVLLALGDPYAGSFSPRLAAAVVAAPWVVLAPDVLLLRSDRRRPGLRLRPHRFGRLVPTHMRLSALIVAFR